MDNSDLEVFRKAKPYVESVLSFILFLRFANVRAELWGQSKPKPADLGMIDQCDDLAAEFCRRIEKRIIPDERR